MNVSIRPIFTILSMLFALTSCGGGDVNQNTGSLLNEDFTGNLVEFGRDMNACVKFTPEMLAALYNAPVKDAMAVDFRKQLPDRFDKSAQAICNLRIQTGENKFDYLSGSIHFTPEVAADEMMGELAQAAGQGENWIESWELQLMIADVEPLKNMGMAALWSDKKAELRIKFDGYTVYINPPKARLNAAENALNRDYKAIAIAIAEQSGLL